MREYRFTTEDYAEIMRGMEQLNEEYLELQKSREYRIGSFVVRLINCIKNRKWKSIGRYIKVSLVRPGIVIGDTSEVAEVKCGLRDVYYSAERIAVYTSIFGKYDHILEPLFQPDNIDYYIITDQEIPIGSKWKKVELDDLDDIDLDTLSNVEKNRYFKMHPEVVFKDYRYSIYVDGNIKIISDLTPMVHKLGSQGLGMHLHSQRSCTFDELNAIVYLHKASKEDADQYAEYLKNHNMPKCYGLLECNVIVREHNNPICKRIMDGWWEQFQINVKRDQVSLPYVLYVNNIAVSEIGVLGNNVYANGSLRVIRHL